MELIAVLILAFALPIFTISAFVIGYNVNAQKKLFKAPKKKAEPTEDEVMLDRIDKATV